MALHNWVMSVGPWHATHTRAKKTKLVGQVVFWHLNPRPSLKTQQTTPAQAQVMSLITFQSPGKKTSQAWPHLWFGLYSSRTTKSVSLRMTQVVAHSRKQWGERARAKTDCGSQVSNVTGVVTAIKSGTEIGRSYAVELPSNVAVWQMRTRLWLAAPHLR